MTATHRLRLAVGFLLCLGIPVLASAETSATAQGRVRCTIVGTAKADKLVGTSKRDVICGRGGNDTIDGRGGDDLILGGPGDDKIVGYRGNDRLVGGLGRDLLDAGDGKDSLFGGDGNDELDGGAGVDAVDGGGGLNFCVMDAADLAKRCMYDVAPPAADQVEVSTDSVDVTSAAKTVVVRVHAIDDTKVSWLLVHAGSGVDLPRAAATLVSGTPRNGWWEATLNIPRWMVPATYQVHVRVEDRLGRVTNLEFPDTFEILDANPDLELPAADLITPALNTTYDTRFSSKDVPIKVRLTDALSGVANATACVHEPRYFNRQIAICTGLKLSSGDRSNGIWTGGLYVVKRAVSGTWNVSITVTDRAHAASRIWVEWDGPDEYAARYWPGDELTKLLPGGMGAFEVIGSAPSSDVTPPTIQSVQVTPTTVDTLPGNARMDISLHVTDAGEGVDSVHARLLPADPAQGQSSGGNIWLDSGTKNDGNWSGYIELPQGTPPGQYYLYVWLKDAVDNSRSYIAAGYPIETGWSTLPGDPVVTVIDSSNP